MSSAQQNASFNLDSLPDLMPSAGGGDDWVTPEPGVYTVQFAEVLDSRQKEFQGKVDPDKLQIKCRFMIQGGEFDGVFWTQWLGYSFHEKSTLTKILTAINAGEPPATPIRLKPFLGHSFKGMVTVDEVPSRNDPSRTMKFAKLIDFKPLKNAEARFSQPTGNAAAAAAKHDPWADDEEDAA